MNSTLKDAPVAPAKAMCWFEVALKHYREVLKDGHPDRIFDSADPRWAQIEGMKRAVAGTLVVGHVKVVDGEFVPKSLAVTHSLQVQWAQAKEMMERFEKTGRIWDTPVADQQKELERARAAGQEDLAGSIVKGLEGVFARMTTGEASK